MKEGMMARIRELSERTRHGRSGRAVPLPARLLGGPGRDDWGPTVTPRPSKSEGQLGDAHLQETKLGGAPLHGANLFGGDLRRATVSDALNRIRHVTVTAVRSRSER